MSVVIPVHNDADQAHAAMISALKQTVPPLEIILVDDGSDLILEVPDAPDDYPHIPVRVYRVTNRGLPAARNTGLMLAQGDAIVFLDADDRLRPSFIERTFPVFAQGNDVVLVGLQEVGPSRNGSYLPGYDRPFDQVTLEHLWSMNRFFYCALLRVSTLKACGGYNPLMAGPWNQRGGHEDHDLWIDLMTRGAKFAAVNEILFDYSTANPNSMIHGVDQPALMAEMCRHHRR